MVVDIITFRKPPGVFHFFTLPLEILDKTKLHPWIFHKIGNSIAKNKEP